LIGSLVGSARQQRTAHCRRWRQCPSFRAVGPQGPCRADIAVSDSSGPWPHSPKTDPDPWGPV